MSQYAHICAGSHDITQSDRTLTKPSIVISKDSWVAADAFIGPGVTIGERAIVGARAVVTKNVDADCVVVGNPAKYMRNLSVE